MLNRNVAFSFLHEAVPTLKLALFDHRGDFVATPLIGKQLLSVKPVLHVIVLTNDAHLVPFTGLVVFLFLSVLCAVLILLSKSPSSLPIPSVVHTIFPDDPVWLCVSSALAGLAFICLIPIMRMCRRGLIQGCKLGVALTGSGLLSFAILMGASRWIDPDSLQFVDDTIGDGWGVVLTLLFDSILPLISLGIVFTGLRRLVPRLGQRSREFRLAQGSRQRMNDLLAALLFAAIGRIFILISSHDSNLATLGMIIMVLSITLIVVGLIYLIRNTLWIRSALCSPPPSLGQLLKPKS